MLESLTLSEKKGQVGPIVSNSFRRNTFLKVGYLPGGLHPCGVLRNLFVAHQDCGIWTNHVSIGPLTFKDNVLFRLHSIWDFILFYF